MKYATIEHTEHGMSVWLDSPTLTEVLVTIETLRDHDPAVELPSEGVECQSEIPVEDIDLETYKTPLMSDKVTYPTIPEGLVDSPYGDYKLTIK